jgi:pimeloyl-ACP methyl ester carboxylesterase
VRLGRLVWFAAGAAAGLYLVDKRRRNLATEPPALRGHRGGPLAPVLVELAGGECVPVIDVGEGPTLFLIPGLTGDSQVFRHQIAALSARYRVVAPNLRTGFDGVECQFDQFAHDVATVMETLAVESACVFGLSFGGPIALRFATLYSDRVWGIVLTNTLARLDLSHVGLNRALLIPVARLTSRFAPELLMRRISNLWGQLGIWVFDPSPGNERIVEYELQAPLRVPLAVGGGRMETFKDCDLRGDLPSLQQPVLMIIGATDTFTPLAWQREIAGLLPNVTYVDIPEGGHLSLISHAEIFNQAMLDWLDQQIAGARTAPRPSSSAETT